MGNTPVGGSEKPNRSFTNPSNIDIQNDIRNRDRTPNRRVAQPGEGQRDMTRSKSMHYDNSYHKPASVNTSVHYKPKDSAELKLAELQKGSAFCSHFMQCCLEIKMNANLNSISNFLTEKDDPPQVSRSPR